MGKLTLITAIASVMWVLPASAEHGGNTLPSERGVTLAELDVCIGPDCRQESERRYFGRYDDDWRYQRGERCREVTIRERRGGEVMVRRERRCD